jgi:hypothetical protein
MSAIVTDLMAQIGECAPDSSIAPGAVLLCEAHARLIANDSISARIRELQTTVSEGVVKAEIRKRSWRVQILQRRVDALLSLIEDRARLYGAEENPGPGAGIGCVVKDYRGKDAQECQRHSEDECAQQQRWLLNCGKSLQKSVFPV